MGHRLIKISTVFGVAEKEGLSWRGIKKDPNSMQVRKACWLRSAHTQMDDVSRESHAR